MTPTQAAEELADDAYENCLFHQVIPSKAQLESEIDDMIELHGPGAYCLRVHRSGHWSLDYADWCLEYPCLDAEYISQPVIISKRSSHDSGYFSTTH